MISGELVFGRYEVQRRLAVGGMGEVLLAIDRSAPPEAPHAKVILKGLKPELAGQEEFLSRFMAEARIGTLVSHANVVKCLELGPWRGNWVLALEWIDGRNLAQWIRAALRAGARIPARLAVQIAIHAARGLHHVHTVKGPDGLPLGAVHRDVSPHNLMVGNDGRARVVDFGLVQTSADSEPLPEGRVAYRAPEVLQGKGGSPASDQYALGVVLWETLCSRRLHAPGTDMDVAANTLTHQVPAPSDVVKDLPFELDAVVKRMTSHDPSRRYPSCAEAADALEAVQFKYWPHTGDADVAQFLATLGPAEEQRSTRVSVTSGLFPVPDLPKRRPLIPTLVLVAALASAFAVWWQYNRKVGAKPPTDALVGAFGQVNFTNLAPDAGR